ncbi:MAG: GLUG motif-containing protein, partial [Halapricum sp.]
MSFSLKDTTAPTIANPSPADGETVSDDSQTYTVDITDGGSGVNESSISVTVEDADGTVFDSVGTGTTGVSFSGGTLTIDQQTYPDGQVNVTVDAADNAGNAATQFSSSFTIEGGAFAGGDGTEANPYQIETVDQLQAMQDYLSANYTLIADIDASGTSEWNGGSGFDPIGDDSTAFTGSFNGSGYTISNLTINRSATNFVGLFGYIDGAIIERTGLENAEIAGRNYVGGLIGYNLQGTITESYASGNVTGNHDVGGLIGQNDGPLNESYATGNVSGTADQVGGLVGWNHGPVNESYATATVTGDTYVGGLVGMNDGTVNESYATGAVDGASHVGGLVGYGNSGTVTDAYWDVNTTNQSSSDGGTGLTTDQLKANKSLTGFDFTNTWDVRAGGEISYPYLLNNTQSPAPGLESLFAGGDGSET